MLRLRVAHFEQQWITQEDRWLQRNPAWAPGPRTCTGQSPVELLRALSIILPTYGSGESTQALTESVADDASW